MQYISPLAETAHIALHKARHKGAVVKADVQLGVSLVCEEPASTMTFTQLREKYECDSVKAERCVSNRKYVVYNWEQVTVVKVKIGGEVYKLNSIGKDWFS